MRPVPVLACLHTELGDSDGRSTARLDRPLAAKEVKLVPTPAGLSRHELQADGKDK